MAVPGRIGWTVAAGVALALGRSCDSTPVVHDVHVDSAGTGRESRKLATCEAIEVTGGNTPGRYDLGGSRNGYNLYVSDDLSSELFFSARDDAAATADDDGAGDDDEGNESGDDERRFRRMRRRLLPGDNVKDMVDVQGYQEEDGGAGRRELGACSEGYWSLAPAGSGYPRLTVGDCATHPVDITVTTWSEVTCADCDEQEYNGAMPAMVCFGEGGGAAETPAPAASGPGAVIVGSCKVLDVGGSYPGLYTVAGSYNGRGDFYSGNNEYNIFFESVDPQDAGSEVTGDDGEYGGDDDASEDDGDGRRRRMLLRSLFVDRSEGRSEDRENARKLAACSEGYWIKAPTGGGYPFYAVADCAAFPEDVSASPWMKVDCDGCDATEMTADQAMDCATGEDAVVATPAPVQPVVAESPDMDTLPSAGPSKCQEVTVTGAREGAYTVAANSTNGAADVYSDDGEWRMFFANPAPALERRARARRLGASDGSLSLSTEDAPPSRTGHGRGRGLQSCDGYWYITPVVDRYPAYAVSDCAEHPADIVSTDWLFLDCEACEVITASPKPDASCTGAPANVKRGGSYTTPAPLALDSSTPSPAEASSSVSSTCSNLLITGDHPGNFTATGTYRGKPDFFNDDGTVNLYFELAVSRRRSLSSTAEAREGEERRRLLPGEVMASAMEEMYGSASRRLAICTSGYWVISPVGGSGYPVLGVPDCADHPVDIRANAWLIASCELCGVVEAPSFVAPTIVCGADAGVVVASDTPSGLPETCGTVYVTGPAAGVYQQSGDYGTRGDFFSGNGAWNMYWVFYAGKPVNRSRNRFRRGLSVPERRGGSGSEIWTEEYELALETLADDLHTRSNVYHSVPDHSRSHSDENDGNGRRRLEVCDDGFWLITPRGGGFPFYGTPNCADHPADIANLAEWSVVACEGCGSEPVDGTVTVSCEGTGFTPPPSTAPPGGVTPSPADDSELSRSSGMRRASVLDGRAWRLTGVVALAVAALGLVL